MPNYKALRNQDDGKHKNDNNDAIDYYGLQ
jgi:hypothetical protein